MNNRGNRPVGKRKHCDKDGCKQPGTTDRPYCPEHACEIDWCRLPNWNDKGYEGYCWHHYHELEAYTSDTDPITPEWLEESSLWQDKRNPDVYGSLVTPVVSYPYISKAESWVEVQRVPSKAFPDRNSWTVRIAQRGITRDPALIDVARFARKRDVLNAMRLLILHPKGENG